MLSGHHVGLLEWDGEGFERHRPIVLQELFAHPEEVGFRGNPPDVMEKSSSVRAALK